MYLNALKHKAYLQLNMVEIYHTKTFIYKNLIILSIGVSAAVSAMEAPDYLIGTTGLIYILISPFLTIFYKLRFKRLKKIFNDQQFDDHHEWINS